LVLPVFSIDWLASAIPMLVTERGNRDRSVKSAAWTKPAMARYPEVRSKRRNRMGRGIYISLGGLILIIIVVAILL
jgi:hypothetical protein